MKTKKQKVVKVKQIKETTSYNGENFIYALGEDGLMYFIRHNPKTNATSWQAIPTAAQRFIG